MSIYNNHKERINTGLALLVLVLTVGYIDNFFVMWLFFGGVYILAFKEAIKLFGVEKDNLLPSAVGLWFLAGFYPYGDDYFCFSSCKLTIL